MLDVKGSKTKRRRGHSAEWGMFGTSGMHWSDRADSRSACLLDDILLVLVDDVLMVEVSDMKPSSE